MSPDRSSRNYFVVNQGPLDRLWDQRHGWINGFQKQRKVCIYWASFARRINATGENRTNLGGDLCSFSVCGYILAKMKSNLCQGEVELVTRYGCNLCSKQSSCCTTLPSQGVKWILALYVYTVIDRISGETLLYHSVKILTGTHISKIISPPVA